MKKKLSASEIIRKEAMDTAIKASLRFASDFMEPQVYEADGLQVDTTQGIVFIPEVTMPKSADVPDFFPSIKDYLEVDKSQDVYDIERIHGWFGRYSAPGYLDATDWIFGNTEEEVREELERLYGMDEEEIEGSRKIKAKKKPFMFFYDPATIEMNGKGLTRGIYEGSEDTADRVLEAMYEALGEDILEFSDEDKAIGLYIGAVTNSGPTAFLVDYNPDAEGVDEVVDQVNDWLTKNVSIEEDDGIEGSRKIKAGDDWANAVDALRAFSDAAYQLTAAWSALHGDQEAALGTSYPRDLPSFDEWYGEVQAWEEAVSALETPAIRSAKMSDKGRKKVSIEEDDGIEGSRKVKAGDRPVSDDEFLDILGRIYAYREAISVLNTGYEAADDRLANAMKEAYLPGDIESLRSAVNPAYDFYDNFRMLQKEITASKMTKKGQKAVSKDIKKYKGHGKKQDQAVAIALSKADKAGYKGAKKVKADLSDKLDNIHIDWDKEEADPDSMFGTQFIPEVGQKVRWIGNDPRGMLNSTMILTVAKVVKDSRSGRPFAYLDLEDGTEVPGSWAVGRYKHFELVEDAPGGGVDAGKKVKGSFDQFQQLLAAHTGLKSFDAGIYSEKVFEARVVPSGMRTWILAFMERHNINDLAHKVLADYDPATGEYKEEWIVELKYREEDNKEASWITHWLGSHDDDFATVEEYDPEEYGSNVCFEIERAHKFSDKKEAQEWADTQQENLRMESYEGTVSVKQAGSKVAAKKVKSGMFDETDPQAQAKAQAEMQKIIKKLQALVKRRGYQETLGQNEIRKFGDDARHGKFGKMPMHKAGQLEMQLSDLVDGLY